jgi:YgiT-type zinc finger domain-containing protein
MISETNQRAVPCPHCEKPMRAATVKTTIWHNERLFVVEDIPAYICDSCVEQFYDPVATDLLRTWTEEDFASAEATKEILVPVFSLANQVPEHTTAYFEEQEIY